MLGFRPLPRTLDAAVRDAKHATRDLVRIEAVRDLGRYAADADAAVRERSVGALCQGLSDSTPAIRGESALALADAAAKPAVAALITAAGDSNQKVRQMVLVALGELAEPGDSAALKVLRAAFADDAVELRYQALIGLARLAPDDNAPLVRCLTDEDSEVRYIALRLTEERFRSRPLPHQVELRVERALSDADVSVRTAAAIWMFQRGNKEAKPVLVGYLNGSFKQVSAEDEIAAVELAGDRRVSEARPGLQRRAFGIFGGVAAWQARVALAQLGDSAAKQRLLQGLRAWGRDARTHAVVAVGRAGMTEARGRLQELQASGEVDAEIIASALAAISGELPADSGPGSGDAAPESG